MSATVDASWDANTAERYGIPAACNAQGDWGKEKGGAVAAAALRSGDWDMLILDLQLLQGAGLGVPYSVTSSARTRVDYCVLTMSGVSVRFVGSNCERPVWFRCRPYT